MISTQISRAVKDNVLLLFSKKAEHEALLSYDFKMLDFKTALMRLCFSPFSNWPLLVLIAVLFLNPFRYQHQIFADIPSLIQFVYSPNWAAGIAIGIICSYFLGLINIPLALVLYFISQGDMHVILGASIVVGIFLGQPLKYLKLTARLEGKIRTVILYFSIVQFISVVISTLIGLQIYQFMNYAGYFSRTVFGYRLEFIVILLITMYLVQLLLYAMWGHFYSRKQEEPSQLNAFYSTALILRRLSYGKNFLKSLKAQASIKHVELSRQLQDESVSYLPRNILQTAETEKTYLEEAMRF